MNTLRNLKSALYGGASPILRWEGRGVPTEVEFVKRFFPEAFCQNSFPGPNGHPLTMQTILSTEAGAKAQRNKVFNGRYTGGKMESDALPILQSDENIWNHFRVKCQGAIAASDPTRQDALRNLLLEYGRSVNNNAYYTFLEQKIQANELDTALASLIICLMARCCIEQYLEIFNGSAALDDQYIYLDHPKKMMKRSFAAILKEKDYTDCVQTVYENYSELLSYTAEISSEGETVEQQHLLDTLYQIIRTETDQKLIRLTGPSGAEKNALAQLLFLRLSYDVRNGRETQLAPYYIDLGYYFREGVNTSEAALTRMKEDLIPFETFCRRQPHRTPLLLVDGIKNYSLDGLELDYILNKLMQELLPDAHYVIAIERGVVMNPYRQKKLPTFASGQFRYEVSMESVYIFDQKKAQAYLDKFQEIYLPNSPEDLYSHLRKLGFDHVDTYQLRVLIPYLNGGENICELYEAVCTAHLNGDTSKLDEAAQWAFSFAYTDRALQPIPVVLQQLINMHDSFVEYFIARYYLSILSDDTAKNNPELLNMVLPKGVTRFIVPMLNSNPALEHRLLNMIESTYDQMGPMAKSEMSYWLGRIQAPNLAARADALLLNYYKQLKQASDTPQAVSPLARKQQLFLLRGICVSLIVKGHQDVLDDYLTALISDETANEINRGFHLEYYGDKAYLPVYDTLDFTDDIEKGQRTLDQLIAAVDRCKEEEDLPLIFELNLFTICSLLQARVERTNRSIAFNVMPYLSRAMTQVAWYLDRSLCDSEMRCQYFKMVQRDFEERITERRQTWDSVGLKAYRLYSRRIYRTGWQDRNIPEPETVAEHMYHTWMLGMLLLPDTYALSKEYSKEKILRLVLIHDMAEVITGDIPRPTKAQNKEMYDRQEQEEIGILFLRGTYPNMPSQMERYDLWQNWDEHSRDLNGKIARELDLIQGMYTLLSYYIQYPDHFTESDVRKWMEERTLIRTNPGKDIFRTVIMNNQEFMPTLKGLGIVK